jgi:hypothetical protein
MLDVRLFLYNPFNLVNLWLEMIFDKAVRSRP